MTIILTKGMPMKSGFALTALIILLLSICTSAIASNYFYDSQINFDLESNIDSNIDVKPYLGSHFTLNTGQIPMTDVILHSQNAYFTPSGVIFRVVKSENNDNANFRSMKLKSSQSEKLVTYVYKMNFLDANYVIPAGFDELSHKSNYFLGNDDSTWATNVPIYNQIIYENIYKDIDLLFKVVPNGIKYEFIVHPFANPKDIKLKYDGVELSKDKDDLLIKTPAGTVRDREFYVYQHHGETDRHVSVEASIVIENNIVSYDIDYDPRHTLIIDPLIYSTFENGRDDDVGYSITIDSAKNPIITGYTWSISFPTTVGVFNTTNNGTMDIFVLKLNATGKNLIYSTYIGGTGTEEARDIDIDSNDNTYITGFTDSNNFPTISGSAYESYNGGITDIIVFKLNPTGNKLLYSTYMGGNDYEHGMSIALDSSNNAYITGYTWSFNYPTTIGAYNVSLSAWEDVIVFKLNPTGTNVIYSAKVGGSEIDYGHGIAVDNSGNAYVTGSTESTDFPITTGAFNETNNDSSVDTFVFKLNATGSDLIYSTYIGGTSEDTGQSITIDSQNNAYITGYTWSNDFPTTEGALKRTYENWTDIFVFKLNTSGDKLIFSTYIGGQDEDYGSDITLDTENNVFIAGHSWSSDFPTTPGAYDKSHDTWEDVIILMLSSTGDRLMYSTYVGGTDADCSYSIVLDTENKAYITGSTESKNFPTTSGANNTVYKDWKDAFILKFGFPKIPNMPANATISSGDGFVLLEWDTPIQNIESPITNYLIYKGTSKNEVTLYETIGKLNEFRDTNLTNGVTYYYKLSAWNSIGESESTLILQSTPGAKPTPPQNLVVTTGDGFINLIWKPPLDTKGFPVTNYIIYRGLNAKDLVQQNQIGNVTRYADMNVEAGVIYYYSVSARNKLGEGKQSDVVTSATGSPPSKPVNLTLQTINNYIILTWGPPENVGGFNVTKYRVYKGIKQDQLFPVAETGIASYIDIIEEFGIDYFFAVTAVNLKGEGEKSDLVHIRFEYDNSSNNNNNSNNNNSNNNGNNNGNNTNTKPVPEIPTLSIEQYNGNLRLKWIVNVTSEYDILYHKIYRGTVYNPLRLIGLTTNLYYLDYNVSNNITYSYVVSSVNIFGEGEKSNIVTAKPIGLPSRPLNLTVNFGDGYVNIHWKPPETTGGLKIVEYNIYRGENELELKLFHILKANSYNDTSVLNGQLYYYSISAVNGNGEGVTSELITAKPFGIPRNIANFTGIRGDGNVGLQWSPPNNYESETSLIWYNVFKGPSPENIFLFLTIMGNNYNDTAVINGRTYYYAISAVNQYGEGPRSNITTVTPGTLSGAPENLKVEMKEGNAILSWKIPTNTGGFPILEYKIYRGLSQDNLGEIARVKSHKFTDKSVSDGTTYYYRVSPVTDLGEGKATEVISVTIDYQEEQARKMRESIFSMIIIIIIILIIIYLFIYFVVKKKKPKHRVEVKPDEDDEEYFDEEALGPRPEPRGDLLTPAHKRITASSPKRRVHSGGYAQPAKPLKQPPKAKRLVTKETAHLPHAKTLSIIQESSAPKPTLAKKPVRPIPKFTGKKPVRPIPKTTGKKPVRPIPKHTTKKPERPIPKTTGKKPVRPIPKGTTKIPVRPIPKATKAKPKKQK
jgi:hypothetical protein